MTRSIAVLGAGTMGHGIAWAAAVGGFETRLFDVSPDALDRAGAAFDTIGAKAVELGKLAADDLTAARRRISMLGDLGAALSGIDFVIEAVPERMDLKLSLATA